VSYADYGVVVELDGRLAHPDETRWRDLRRDNAALVQGRRVLRYGWPDVTNRACEVAEQVASVLRTAGWRGTPLDCGLDCAIRGELAG
jgi:very-short-patch-repair endonuclease